MTDALTAAFYAMRPEDRRPEKRKASVPLVPPLQAPARLRQAAEAARRLAIMELTLPFDVHIRWFDPTRSPRSGERFINQPIGREAHVKPIDHPTEVFLSVRAVKAGETTLHEVRHLWQYAHADDWYPDPRVCDVDNCGQLIYELTPADEDRLELDAFLWERAHASEGLHAIR